MFTQICLCSFLNISQNYFGVLKFLIFLIKFTRHSFSAMTPSTFNLLNNHMYCKVMFILSRFEIFKVYLYIHNSCGILFCGFKHNFHSIIFPYTHKCKTMDHPIYNFMFPNKAICALQRGK